MNIREATSVVSAMFRVPVPVLMGAAQDITTSRARFALYWFGRERLGYSYGRIGKALSRDHTTVIHGYRRALELRASDPEFLGKTDSLMEEGNG